jgi:hypothetical protein
MDRKKEYKSAYNNWECKYCKEIFRTRNLLYQHFRTCKEKQKLDHDSLGRIKNPIAYKKATETLKRRIDSGEIILKGHPHTQEMREHLSKKRIEYLQDNPHILWYEVNGIKVQGNWEKTFAEKITDFEIRWKRKTLKFQKVRRCTPDFYLIDYNMYIEVKGWMKDRDKYKYHLLLKEHDIDLRIIESYKEIKNITKEKLFKLEKFISKYPYESIDFSSFNNIYAPIDELV